MGIQLPRVLLSTTLPTNSSYTLYQDEPIEEKSSLEKTFEAFLESTRQVQIIADSILPNNSQIQDPYSNFQVQPQQEEPIDLEKSTEDLIQSGNNVTQSINRLEAKVGHLVNTINDRNEETLPNTFFTLPSSPSHIDEESWYLRAFNQDSFSPKNFELEQY